ncbi:hypothetical protein AGMMS49928_19480 [Spirochaetia bacterium]|nr:hypothetical protein AGMMS49928_19480 [Spirochaetia bacterium]
MYQRKAHCLAALLWLAPVLLFAQSFPRSAVLDPALYDSLPQKAVQVSRAYESLPASASLKQYAPRPGNQGNYGTCAAWSSAYAARTILESITLNRRDRLVSTANVFSPTYVYKSMFIFNNQPDDPAGQRGAAVAWALSFMRDKGPVKMLDAEMQAAFPNISLSLFANSRAYPIAEYATLFRSDARDRNAKIQMVKKSIAESKPVIIGMNCPASFNTAKEVWRPNESSAANHGGHAMCVVGYDDTKYGGSFEIQNSWGEAWGNAGFIWIPYEVFADFVWEAYGISENVGNYQQTVKYSGFANIEVRGGANMAVAFKNGYYQTVSSYPSGTRFRYLLGNREAAFVYAFAADESGAAPTRIFPPEGSTVSPFLDYSESVIAFPGEFTWIQLDNTAGTDYLVVLYSKRALNIAAIQNRFAREQGAFPERVARAVGSDYIPAAQIQYNPNGLAFTAASANPTAVFGLLLAITHQ